MPLLDCYAVQVSGVQPAHAFALHAAGFVSPDLLVSASESDIAAALAAKVPNMRKRKAKGNRWGQFRRNVLAGIVYACAANPQPA